jgi:hypothetical protein
MAACVGHFPAARLLRTGKNGGWQHTCHQRLPSDEESQQQNTEFGTMPHQSSMNLSLPPSFH